MLTFFFLKLSCFPSLNIIVDLFFLETFWSGKCSLNLMLDFMCFIDRWDSLSFPCLWSIKELFQLHDLMIKYQIQWKTAVFQEPAPFREVNCIFKDEYLPDREASSLPPTFNFIELREWSSEHSQSVNVYKCWVITVLSRGNSEKDKTDPVFVFRKPAVCNNFLENQHWLSVQFSCSVLSDSLWPHGLQHTRPPCPSATPRTYPNSCPLSRWCHPTISSSVVPFSSCPQSLPASGSFQMSQLFASGGQSIGVSASASVLPMNIQDWFPLGLTVLISLQSQGLSRVFSNTTVQKHQFFGTQFSL